MENEIIMKLAIFSLFDRMYEQYINSLDVNMLAELKDVAEKVVKTYDNLHVCIENTLLCDMTIRQYKKYCNVNEHVKRYSRADYIRFS